LKKKTDSFAQIYAAAVNLQPQELISMMALVCCAQAVFSGKKKEHDEAESAIQEEENKFLSLQRRLQSEKTALAQIESDLRRARDEARRKKHPVTDADRAAWLELPQDIWNLDRLIAECQAKRGQLQHATDRQADCERNRAKVVELEGLLAEMQRRSEGTSTVLQEETRKWLEAVKELEKTCDTEYSSMLRSLGKVGGIELSGVAAGGGTNVDFAQAGLELKVSFHKDRPVERINAHTLSGGEKSVVTMLFLLTLQQFARCPFRCVDEINQGMDHKNERFVFEQLVRTSSQPNTPQTVIITPKLLPSLFDSHAASGDDNIAVHVMMKGNQHLTRATSSTANALQAFKTLKRQRPENFASVVGGAHAATVQKQASTKRARP